MLLVYSRKSVGPRMKSWGTPALTGYSCEDFPSKKKRRNNTKYLTLDLHLWRRPTCQTLSKAMDMSSATAQVAPKLLKALAILSDTTVSKKICSWSRWPKTILEIRKKITFLLVINNSIICKFFTNHRKMTNRAVVYTCRHFLTILKYWDHQWNLPTIWKTRLFQTLGEEFS